MSDKTTVAVDDAIADAKNIKDQAKTDAKGATELLQDEVKKANNKDWDDDTKKAYKDTLAKQLFADNEKLESKNILAPLVIEYASVNQSELGISKDSKASLQVIQDKAAEVAKDGDPVKAEMYSRLAEQYTTLKNEFRDDNQTDGTEDTTDGISERDLSTRLQKNRDQQKIEKQQIEEPNKNQDQKSEQERLDAAKAAGVEPNAFLSKGTVLYDVARKKLEYMESLKPETERKSVSNSDVFRECANIMNRSGVGKFSPLNPEDAATRQQKAIPKDWNNLTSKTELKLFTKDELETIKTVKEKKAQSEEMKKQEEPKQEELKKQEDPKTQEELKQEELKKQEDPKTQEELKQEELKKLSNNELTDQQLLVGRKFVEDNFAQLSKAYNTRYEEVPGDSQAINMNQLRQRLDNPDKYELKLTPDQKNYLEHLHKNSTKVSESNSDGHGYNITLDDVRNYTLDTIKDKSQSPLAKVQSEEERKNAEVFMDKRLTQFDKNDDNVVTLHEIRNYAQTHVLTPAEKQMLRDYVSSQAEGRRQLMTKRFDEIDTTPDAYITDKELEAYSDLTDEQFKEKNLDPLTEQERKMLLQIRQESRQIMDRSNDEIGTEDNGITRKDMTADTAEWIKATSGSAA